MKRPTNPPTPTFGDIPLAELGPLHIGHHITTAVSTDTYTGTLSDVAHRDNGWTDLWFGGHFIARRTSTGRVTVTPAKEAN